MFTNYYKMTSTPFSENILTENIIQDDRVSQTLSKLNYLVHSGTIGLLTGNSGCGKTCVLKAFISSLPRNKYRSIYINFTSLKSSGILRLVLKNMGEQVTSNFGKEKTYLNIVEKLNEDDLTTVLIIDESHILSNEALIDLRLLSGADTSKLKMLLCGQDELRKKLKAFNHQALLNRMSVQHHLPAFDKNQTISYINSNLKLCGASTKLISDDSKILIHEHSGGLARNINNTATAVLIAGISSKKEIIDFDFVNKVIEELHAW